MKCLKDPEHAGWPGAEMIMALVAVMFLSLLASCSEPSGASAPPPASAVTNAAPADVTVELSSNQLNAIKIGPVATHFFPVEKEAVGSVSFDEDPAIVQAESTLLGAAATAGVTSNELVRARSLYETNGVAQRELEQAVSDAQTAGAALKAARDAVRVLGKTDAEIDQIISTGAIGPALSAQSPVKWVLANVLESDSPFIQAGQPVRVELTAFPGRAFEGKVSKIYATVDPNLHRLPIRCEVNDPQGELRPGMLATVAIQVADPVAAPAIPPNAVVREGDGTLTAWVTTDRQHFTQRVIKTGMREDGEVQILEGLRGDKLVVTDGAIFLDNMVNAVPSD
jgi:cobalt-zinc-cadmium efflux system membrane fusion protein